MAGFADMINPPTQMAQAPVNFQQAGQFQQALSPQPAAPQDGPPTTPQEMEQRKSGWMDFMTKLQTDPAVRQAAFMAAGQMMRGADQGESVGAGLGRAVQLGTLAHGFIKGNQTKQAMDQTRLEETQRLNASNIAQNEAQTDGLRQQQQFAQEAQPGKMQLQTQQVGEGDFAAANRQMLLQDQLETSASARDYKKKHGNYFAQRGNAATAGPKTPAGVALLERQREELKIANPPGVDEHPADYEARISGMVLDYGRRAQGGGNPQAVQVQAIQKLLDTMDTSDPMFATMQKRLADIATGSSGGGNAAAPVAAGNSISQEAWAKARDSVPVGKPYKGPDGKMYMRGQ